MDGTIAIDRPNMGFNSPTSPLWSPVAAVAGPWENIVDRDMDASYFFTSTVAAPAGCSHMLFSRRADLRSPICIRGAYPTLANP